MRLNSIEGAFRSQSVSILGEDQRMLNITGHLIELADCSPKVREWIGYTELGCAAFLPIKTVCYGDTTLVSTNIPCKPLQAYRIYMH